MISFYLQEFNDIDEAAYQGLEPHPVLNKRWTLTPAPHLKQNWFILIGDRAIWNNGETSQVELELSLRHKNWHSAYDSPSRDLYSMIGALFFLEKVDAESLMQIGFCSVNAVQEPVAYVMDETIEQIKLCGGEAPLPKFCFMPGESLYTNICVYCKNKFIGKKNELACSFKYCLDERPNTIPRRKDGTLELPIKERDPL